MATAIHEGADAVMLSAESASGRYPVESAAMMDAIIGQTEADPCYRDAIDAEHTPSGKNVPDAIGRAMRSVAGLLDVAAMVAYASSGASVTGMRWRRKQGHDFRRALIRQGSHLELLARGTGSMFERDRKMPSLTSLAV